MNFPILSVIVFTPVVAGLILMLFPKDRHDWIRWFALAAASLGLALSLAVFIGYDTSEAGYQFTERAEWIPVLGISYFIGVDGMSAPLVLLTGIVMFTGVLISWRRGGDVAIR